MPGATVLWRGHICCSSSYCRGSWSSTGELHPRLWHRNNRQNRPLLHAIRLRNDLYCVGWGVKLYSLTHSLHANRKPGTQCRLSAHPAELARPRVPYAGRRPHRRTIAGGWCCGLQPATFDVSSPCILAVSSLSNSMAWLARDVELDWLDTMRATCATRNIWFVV